MGELLGQRYVKEYFNAQAKARYTQLVEDIADLVFLEYYLEPFAAKHDYDEAKWCDILQKTWRKMSPEARAFALSGKVRLPQPLVPLLNKALADFAD